MIIINLELLWYYIGEALKIILLGIVVACLFLGKYMISIICALLLVFLMLNEIRDILIYETDYIDEPEQEKPGDL